MTETTSGRSRHWMADVVWGKGLVAGIRVECSVGSGGSVGGFWRLSDRIK